MKNRYPIAVGGAFFVSILAYAYTLSPNMNLRIPATGDTDYPTSIADSFTTIDTHDHTAGKGLQVPSSGLAANSVTTVKILDATVTEAKIATDAVTEDKIEDFSVTTNKIALGNVTTDKILDANVTTTKIADGNVTAAKLVSDINLVGLATQISSKIPVVSASAPASGRLAIVQGLVSSTGVALSGQGYTSSKVSTGRYNIVFNVAFSTAPAITITPNVPAGTMGYHAASNGDTSHAEAYTYLTSFGSADTNFYFIAIGNIGS